MELHRQDQVGGWIINDFLGQGAFSTVYSVFNRNGGNVEYAMKLCKVTEHIKKIGKKSVKMKCTEAQLLFAERNIYQRIGKFPGVPSIPPLNWYGDSDGYRYLVVEKLDKSLEEIRTNSQICIEDIFLIASQTISLIEYLHKQKILHRDIKPQNILTKNHVNQIYLIDYGTADVFVDYHGKLQPIRSNKGTPRFASLSVYQNQLVTPIDDLISLGYVLIYLVKGHLPWDDGKSDQEVNLIKASNSIDQLTKDLPQQFEEFFTNINKRRVSIQDNYNKIDYSDLLQIFNTSAPPLFHFLSQSNSSNIATNHIVDENTSATIDTGKKSHMENQPQIKRKSRLKKNSSLMGDRSASRRSDTLSNDNIHVTDGDESFTFKNDTISTDKTTTISIHSNSSIEMSTSETFITPLLNGSNSLKRKFQHDNVIIPLNDIIRRQKRSRTDQSK